MTSTYIAIQQDNTLQPAMSRMVFEICRINNPVHFFGCTLCTESRPRISYHRVMVFSMRGCTSIIISNHSIGTRDDYHRDAI